MSTLPLQNEMQRLLDHDLWLLREAMSQEEQELDEHGQYVIPARFYLPLLHNALESWNTAKAQAQKEVPHMLHFKLKLANIHATTGTEDLARIEPEVRRWWLVDRIYNLMQQAVEILENEGRPPGPPPNLKLGKARP